MKHKLKPVGHHVLIKALPFERATKSGIITSSEIQAEREENGRDIGEIVEFGPIAYKGFADCEGPKDWGVKVGDIAEFKRYAGKKSRMADTDKSLNDYFIVNDDEIVSIVETCDE